MFKKKYNFVQKDIIKKSESLYCDGVCIKENDKSDYIGECEKFVNVGYKLCGATPKLLSNLFPYKFYFKGFYLNSVESFFQAIKFKDKKSQKFVFTLSRTDAANIKYSTDYDWKTTNILYFQGKQYKRDSMEYENLIDELYVSLLQNPLYVGALKNVGDKYIIHAIGETDETKTVFTRYEFEKQLNCLKEYCKLYK